MSLVVILAVFWCLVFFDIRTCCNPGGVSGVTAVLWCSGCVFGVLAVFLFFLFFFLGGVLAVCVGI